MRLDSFRRTTDGKDPILETGESVIVQQEDEKGTKGRMRGERDERSKESIQARPLLRALPYATVPCRALRIEKPRCERTVDVYRKPTCWILQR